MSDRADSYANALTGLASNLDKSTYGTFVRRNKLDYQTLGDLYEQGSIAARIVDRVVDDATSGGYSIKSTDTDFDPAEVRAVLDELDAVSQIADAWRWGRLYGGALLVLSVNDGLRMDQPLNLPTATKIQALNVIEAPYVTPDQFSPRMGARAFADPEFYLVHLPFGREGAQRKIHKSRVLRFDGVHTSPAKLVEHGGWGPSVIDRVWDELRQLGQAMGYASNIMHDLSVMVVKLEGLRAMLCGGPEQEAQARKILESMRQSMDNIHALALDKQDSYEERTRTVTGLEKLIEKFVDALVRATDMPRTVILGEQPGGLNAGADGEIRSWLDHVAAAQRQVLAPALGRILEVQFAIIENKGQRPPESWSVEFDPLWRPSQRENAETLDKVASALQKLILQDVIDPDEARSFMVEQGLIHVEV